MKIMFVCYANTCRSMMAEAIFKKISGDDMEVFSSGIAALNGNKAFQMSCNVCRAHGIDISYYTSTYFKDSNIEDMDLVLTFEIYQAQKIKMYYPGLKVCTIREFIGEYPSDIDDPFGGDFIVYESCFLEILRVLKKIFYKLK